VDKRVKARKKRTRRDARQSKEIIYSKVGQEQRPELGFSSVEKIVGEYKDLVALVNAVNMPSLLDNLDKPDSFFDDFESDENPEKTTLLPSGK
jgi:hypothetical protein